MSDAILVVAIGCGRLPGMLDLASRHPFVVFGTMDGRVLADLRARSVSGQVKVHFYESG